MSLRPKSVRITEDAHKFLSGFTNLGVSPNLELIIDVMQNHPDALSLVLDYLRANKEAVKCSSEGKELFKDYVLIERAKIKKLESRISNKEYRERVKYSEEEQLQRDSDNMRDAQNEADARDKKVEEMEKHWVSLDRDIDHIALPFWINVYTADGFQEAEDDILKEYSEIELKKKD